MRLITPVLRGSLRRQQAERKIYVFLALYRYMTYMTAVVLLAVIPSAARVVLPLEDSLALAIGGGHLVFRVAFPQKPRSGSLLAIGGLAVDLAASMSTVLMTGGLDSPMLLYSLSPVLTSALFLEQRITVAVSVLLSGVFLAPHLASVRGFPWILEGNYLVTFLLFAGAAGVMSLLPYRANLSVQQGLEAAGMDQERLRLRREIHDNVAQDLAFLNMKVKQMQHAAGDAPISSDVSELSAALGKAYRDVRSYLDVLGVPSNMLLAAALSDLAKEFTQKTGVAVKSDVVREPLGISPLVEVEIVAIAREALTNVEKHARASEVRLALRADPAEITLVVEDNGEGFRASGNGNGTHYGLAGMQDRANEIGAKLSVSSTPSQGTAVQLVLPR